MTTATTYDEIPYPTYPRWVAHPDHMFVMGLLHGLAPVAAERCRVLEFGCSDGGHLLPLAQALPHSEFLGIELSADAVARGQALIRACGLANVELRQGDLCTLPDLGRFDYVVAHGVYSWVAADVRDHLLRLSAACLAEHGIAFVSYTVFPGAHVNRMLRDMLRYHAGTASGRPRLERARELLAFLANTKAPPELYRQLCRDEYQRLQDIGDESYYHDALTDVHDSVYFHEFMAHAGKHGLQFVTDTAFVNPIDRYYAPEIVAKLHRLAGDDRLEREQHRDLLEGRMYRETLLCRADRTVSPVAQLERVADLNVHSAARPITVEPDLTSAVIVDFHTPVRGGQTIKTGHPLSKVALSILAERWPESLPVGELIALARQRLGAPPRTDAGREDANVRMLLEFLLVLNSSEFVKLHRHVPTWSRTVSDRPVASPLARCQADRGLPIVNVWHQIIPLADPMQRRLVWLLDGTRDRSALVEALVEFVIGTDMAARENEASTRSMVTDMLEARLQEIARLGLLIG